MNKQNKNVFKTDSTTEVNRMECNSKSRSGQSNVELNYLNYLRRELLKSISNFSIRLKCSEATNKPERTNLLKEIFKFELKEALDVESKDIISFVPEDITSKPIKTNIFKKVFKREPKKIINADSDKVDETFKNNNLSWILRKYFIIREAEQKHNLQKPHKFKETLIDFTAGSLAGIAQVYASQPLDTVKVKQQTFPKLYSNMFKCLLHTYRADGIIRGLYAGTLPAVIASVAENSILFTAYGACQNVVAFIMVIDKVDEMSTFGNACAGFLAAFFSTFTLCPTELIKCKLQAVHEMKHYVSKHSKAMPISTIKLMKDIFINEGIHGFYRGLAPTLVREMPGSFFFFGGYEATRNYFTQHGQSKNDISPLETMCSGAVGGVALWTTTYPSDVIKSRIQINNLNGSMLSVGADILRKEGFFAFYNGLLPTILRTIPATATLFLVYEYSKKILTAKL